MAYFKWEAYDRGFKYHEGVVESRTAMEAARSVGRDGLGPRKMHEISYHEYRMLKARSDRLERLRRRADSLNPPPTTQHKLHLPWPQIIIVACILLLLLLAALSGTQ